MSAKAKQPKASDPPLFAEPDRPIIVQFPSSVKLLGWIVSMLVAVIAWIAVTTISEVRGLSKEMSTVNSRLTGIETKLEILTPLPEQISKLTSEIAELRGQLSGKGSAAAKSSVSD